MDIKPTFYITTAPGDGGPAESPPIPFYLQSPAELLEVLIEAGGKRVGSVDDGTQIVLIQDVYWTITPA